MKLKNHPEKVILLTLLFCLVIPGGYSQSTLEADIGLYGGGEYNIFKSPDILLDRVTGDTFPQDSLIYTDLFLDAELDIDFLKLTKRGVFETGGDLWYRNYIEFTDLNQGKFKAYASYGYNITKSLNLGGTYYFNWSDRIGTSVTGDLLMRSFKYLGNTGRLFMKFIPSEDLHMNLFAEYEYKNYYDEQTRDPLDHANLELNYELEYEINRDNDFSFEISAVDRNYFYYHALDSTGNYIPSNPLRHFRYYQVKSDYNWSPVKGLRINPGIEGTRRTDLFQDYYSYWSYGGSLRLRYFRGNFYISLYGDYKRMEYDIRPAFTSLDNDPMLIYGYYDLKFTFRYSISDNWDIFLILESDNRTSNTDLEYFKTRRPYNTYLGMIGVRYSLPEMRWK